MDGRDEAKHVYVMVGTSAIDVDGRRSEMDILRDYKERANRTDVVCDACDPDILFRAVPRKSDNEKGVRNIWYLRLDPAFIAFCRQVAQSIIADAPPTYAPVG